MAKQNPYMQMVYQAFLNNGYSPNQARAITAEVGRENDFNPKYLFGTHGDQANKETNIGIISWQKGRRSALIQQLQNQGLIDAKGNIQRSQAALDAQVKFLTNEIRTNKAYEETKRKFLNNPNVDYATANRVLGKNFIRWDYDGKHLGANVKAHHAKRDGYYQQLGGIPTATAAGNATGTAIGNAIAAASTPPANTQQIAFNANPSAGSPNPNGGLVAQNTDITPPTQAEQPTPNTNPLSAWQTATQATNNALTAPTTPSNTRDENWRIQTLTFDDKPRTPDPYAEQYAAGFGEIPDTPSSLPDYLTQLARTIYDNA